MTAAEELMRQCRRDHARRAELESIVAEGGVIERREGGPHGAGTTSDPTASEAVALMDSADAARAELAVMDERRDEALRLVDRIGRRYRAHLLAWLAVDAYYLDPAMPTWDEVGAALDCPKGGSTVRGWAHAALWWAQWTVELMSAHHDADAM